MAQADRTSLMEEGVVTRLQALIGAPHVSETYVRFRLYLLAAQQAARRTLERGWQTGKAPAPPPGSLPLAPRDVWLPADVLGGLLGAVRAAALAHGRETEDLRRLTAAVTADPGLLPRLAAAAAFGPDVETLEALARRWGIHVEVLLFLGRALAAPCLVATLGARSRLVGPVPAVGEPHRCPACGSPPGIARLRRADGRRVLTCGLCGTEWEGERLACAYCGTREHERLGMLRLADGDARWIETCEVCRGYIKTVDERKLADDEAVLAVVEEAATLHLDLLAEREGYMRRVPSVLAG